MPEVVELWKNKTEGWVKSVAVSASGDYIAAGSYDGNVYLFDKSGKALWKYKTKRRADMVVSVSVSRSGEYIAVGTNDGDVYLLNREKKNLWTFKTEGRFNAAMCVDVLGEGDGAVVGCYDAHIYLLDKKGAVAWKYHSGTPFQRGYVWDVSASPSGYIAAGCYGNIVYLFDKNGKLIWTFKATDANAAMSVSISDRGERIGAGSDDKNVYMLNKDGRLLWAYTTEGRIKSVSISKGGNYIAAGAYDGNVYMLDEKGKLISKTRIGEGFVWGVAISSLGGYLALGSSDKHIYFDGITVSVEAAIAYSASVIDGAKKLGTEVSGAEAMINEAKSAAEKKEYEKAIEIAQKVLESFLDTRTADEIEDRCAKLKDKDKTIALNNMLSLVAQARKEFKTFLLEDAKNIITQKEYLYYRKKELTNEYRELSAEDDASFRVVAEGMDPEKYRKILEERNKRKTEIKAELKDIDAKLYKE